MKKLLLISFFCLSSELFADECENMEKDCVGGCYTYATGQGMEPEKKDIFMTGCSGCCQRAKKTCQSYKCNKIFDEANKCPFDRYK